MPNECDVYNNALTAICEPFEITPIIKEFPGGAVFKGGGNSHPTIDNGRFPETTEVPGLNQGVRINIKNDIIY